MSLKLQHFQEPSGAINTRTEVSKAIVIEVFFILISCQLPDYIGPGKKSHVRRRGYGRTGIAACVAGVSASEMNKVVNLLVSKHLSPFPGPRMVSIPGAHSRKGGGEGAGVSVQVKGHLLGSKQSRHVYIHTRYQWPPIPSLPPSLAPKSMPNSGETTQLSNQGEWRMGLLGSNFFSAGLPCKLQINCNQRSEVSDPSASGHPHPQEPGRVYHHGNPSCCGLNNALVFRAEPQGSCFFAASPGDARPPAPAPPWMHLRKLPGLRLDVGPAPPAGLEGGAAAGRRRGAPWSSPPSPRPRARPPSRGLRLERTRGGSARSAPRRPHAPALLLRAGPRRARSLARAPGEERAARSGPRGEAAPSGSGDPEPRGSRRARAQGGPRASGGRKCGRVTSGRCGGGR